MLLERVRRAIVTHDLLGVGTAGGVALSGGGDSLCLLHLLSRLAARLGLRLEALVVDHGLRPESAGEARRAAALAAEIGVPSAVLEARVPREGSGNLQQRARDARLGLLRAHALARGLRWVALGHTATDQAETVLMRATRGAGLRGMGGMRWKRPFSGRGGEGEPLIVRPLLEITREEVAAYLARHGLVPVVDPTNATGRYFRNRVRHRVLPELAQENPRVVHALCRLAETCREDDESLEHAARALLDAGAGLEVATLRSLPRGVLARVLRVTHGSRIRHRHGESIVGLLAGDEGTVGVDVPGARVERRYGRLVWLRQPERPVAALVEPVRITGPGRARLPDGRTLVLERVAAQGPLEGHALAADRLRFPLLVRAARPGDRIAVGPGRTKKVARVLLDAKVPRAERPAVPLVCTLEGEVLLVVGIRRAYGWGAAPGGAAIVVRLEGER